MVPVAVDTPEERVRVPPGDDDLFQFRYPEIRIVTGFLDDALQVDQDGVGNFFVTQPLHVAENH